MHVGDRVERANAPPGILPANGTAGVVRTVSEDGLWFMIQWAGDPPGSPRFCASEYCRAANAGPPSATAAPEEERARAAGG